MFLTVQAFPWTMKIRTITAGIRLSLMRLDEQVETVGDVMHRLRDRLTSKGYEVQSLRLSTQPWSEYLEKAQLDAVIQAIEELEDVCRGNGIDFVSVGPASDPRSIRAVPTILERTGIVCCSASIGDREHGVLDDNIRAAAETVLDLSGRTANGALNFMFASLASCQSDIPFFPASYHTDEEPCMTIGLENGDLVQSASSRASGLKELTSLLSYDLNERMTRLGAVIDTVSGRDDLPLKGMDASLVPGLDEGSSIAAGIEKLTGSPFGSHGTLSVCASLTKALEGVTARRWGYNGLMLPVMEDPGLARAADLGSLDLQKLLLYSSVCGTGLDTIPVPGDIPPTRLCAVLRDVAYLSIRLGKPLSARLLPVPGRSSGESTQMGSPYLKDCAILSVV